MILNHGNSLPRIFNEVFVVVCDCIVIAHLSYQKSGKALANVMNTEYSRDEKGMIIKVNMDQISNYFDIEGDEGEKV
jgi:hypothetical protein